MKATAGAAGPATSNTAKALRRVLYGVFATCLAGGAAAAVMAVVPPAMAANDPCAASEVARTIGSVAINTGNYLDTHPETNMALTAAAQRPGPQALAAVKTYFDANTQASKDLQGLQQPLQSLSGRCKLPITLPQMLQFVQAAPSGLGPNAASPAATGPLPGPSPAPPVSAAGSAATAPASSGSTRTPR